MALGSVGRGYCKKNGVLEFLAKFLARLPERLRGLSQIENSILDVNPAIKFYGVSRVQVPATKKNYKSYR